jgi:hypothetical protein
MEDSFNVGSIKQIEAMLVNGTLTWQHGAHRGTRNGQVITRMRTATADD